MTVADTFFKQFEILADAPNAVPKLRELILQLAVRGKLVSQDPNDEPASILIKKIQSVKDSIKKRRTKNIEPPALLTDIEIPFKIPYAWQWARFSQVSICRDEERIPIEKSIRENHQGVYDYYGASGIIDKFDDYIFDKPLLLIGEDGANLVNRSTKIAFLAYGKYWVNNHAHVIDSISIDCLKYLEVFINAIDLKPFLTGTAQPKMSQSKMNSIPIAFPPLNEQKRIAEKVDKLMEWCDRLEKQQQQRRETCINLNRVALTQLTTAKTTDEFSDRWQKVRDNFDLLYSLPENVSQLRQTILQLAVMGKLVKQDPNDEPASILLQRVKNKKDKKEKQLFDIDRQLMYLNLPQNWSWTRIGSLSKAIEYGTSHKADEFIDAVPVLRMNNIRNGKIVFENLKYLSDSIDDLPKLYLQNGDLLFNRTNSAELVGKTGLYRGENNKYTFASYLIRIALFLEDISPEFVNLAMNSNFYRQTQIAPEITQQCGQANFNGTKLKNSIIPLPPLNEQKRIVAKVEEMMRLCDGLEAKLKEAETNRQKLLESGIRKVLSQI
ncbi:restriction endonuclease subunit S [Pseudanabaena sp. UWO310]|uniref:restriction endonuclease subunit S n=1 Tax=Pseudanabaena sp. UWO310 TaxID=2480795 RepID=UPI00115B7001|nr:restriction endonuclease subunit S [Pseudanabaena sp. UWO310]TYQ32088.1 restriction endonuclease subunit S [Pseudanabaena sp. UWO310]